MPRVKNATTENKPSEKESKKTESKKTESKKSKKTESKVTAESAVDQVVATANVDASEAWTQEAVPATEACTQETVSSAADDFTKVLFVVQELAMGISALKTQLRTLEKKHVREMKVATKSKRRAASKAPRTPSGFVKPTKISAELAAFLGKSDNTEMARTEVTKEINAYIRSNGLQNKDNGRIINADTKLKTLLNLNGEDQLTYFNLQRYMSPHFPKSQTEQ